MSNRLIDKCLEKIPTLESVADQLPGFHDASLRVALISTTRASEKGRVKGDPADYFIKVLCVNEKERYNDPLPEDVPGIKKKVTNLEEERCRRKYKGR